MSTFKCTLYLKWTHYKTLVDFRLVLNFKTYPNSIIQCLSTSTSKDTKYLRHQKQNTKIVRSEMPSNRSNINRSLRGKTRLEFKTFFQVHKLNHEIIIWIHKWQKITSEAQALVTLGKFLIWNAHIYLYIQHPTDLNINSTLQTNSAF